MWVKNITDFGRFCDLNIPCLFVPLKGTQTWRLQTKLYKFGQNVFPKIFHMKYCTDLILGRASFSMFIFFHFQDSRLSVLQDFHF